MVRTVILYSYLNINNGSNNLGYFTGAHGSGAATEGADTACVSVGRKEESEWSSEFMS